MISSEVDPDPEKTKNGKCNIMSEGDGRFCLNLKDNKTDNDGEIILAGCGENTKESVWETENGIFKKNGYCLSIKGSNGKIGGDLYVVKCDESPEQKFKIKNGEFRASNDTCINL